MAVVARQLSALEGTHSSASLGSGWLELVKHVSCFSACEPWCWDTMESSRPPNWRSQIMHAGIKRFFAGESSSTELLSEVLWNPEIRDLLQGACTNASIVVTATCSSVPSDL